MKRSEAIIGIGKNPEEKLIVQKATPLFEALWRSNFTLATLKIMDAYLARINSREPDKNSVIFTKGEIERLLGVKKINKSDLEDRLKNLCQPVELEKLDNRKIHLVSLFEEAYAEQDEYGVWQVLITCTNAAKRYFFNIEEIGYLRYKLRCVTCLTSRYTYILFLYLEKNRYRKSWEVSLEDLKVILNCEKEEVYKEYKRFNDRLLKRCYNELTEKTECRFTYEPVKKGRSVVAIRFELETIADIIQNTPVPELEQLKEENQKNSTLDFLTSACEEEFTAEEMEVIFSIISTMQLPVHPEGLDFARYHYLAEKYAILKLEDKKKKAEKKKIENRFNYFKAMIIKDREAGGTGQIEGQIFLEDYPGVVPKKTVHSTSSAKKYNDYPQREHESGFYEDLELKLQQKAWENIVDVEQNDMNDIKEEEPDEMNEMEKLYELIQKLGYEEFEKLMKEVKQEGQ